MLLTLVLSLLLLTADITCWFCYCNVYFVSTGYYGTERTERSLKDFPVKDEDADEETKFKEELSRWKRTDGGKLALVPISVRER